MGHHRLETASLLSWAILTFLLFLPLSASAEGETPAPQPGAPSPAQAEGQASGESAGQDGKPSGTPEKEQLPPDAGEAQKDSSTDSAPDRKEAAPADAPDTGETDKAGADAKPSGAAGARKEASAGSAKDGKQDKAAKEKPDVCWLPLRALVTSPFGAARGRSVDSDGETHVDHYHSGVDLRAHLGWPIKSLKNGTCVQAGPRGSAGIAVEIRQEDGKTAVYCHLSRALVKPGETVSRGQHVGLVGCTGRTTGAHLHLTMRDAAGRLINPMREVSDASEVFDPPSGEMDGSVGGQSCDGQRFASALPYGDRNAAPRRALYQGPNKRLRGMQQYLRMRKALKGISDYKIPDIITWQSMQK